MFWKLFKFNIGCWLLVSALILSIYIFGLGFISFISALTFGSVIAYLIAAVAIITIVTLIERFTN